MYMGSMFTAAYLSIMQPHFPLSAVACAARKSGPNPVLLPVVLLIDTSARSRMMMWRDGTPQLACLVGVGIKLYCWIDCERRSR